MFTAFPGEGKCRRRKRQMRRIRNCPGACFSFRAMTSRQSITDLFPTIRWYKQFRFGSVARISGNLHGSIPRLRKGILLRGLAGVQTACPRTRHPRAPFTVKPPGSSGNPSLTTAVRAGRLTRQHALVRAGSSPWRPTAVFPTPRILMLADRAGQVMASRMSFLPQHTKQIVHGIARGGGEGFFLSH